jgi:CheY-like chemotaxis protein/PAS domain-containing protein
VFNQNTEYLVSLFLSEVWYVELANQLYLIFILILFSLIAYLFIKNRRDEDHFILNQLEQKAYLRAISTYIRSAVAVVDGNDQIKFANTRFLKLFNLTSEEVEGKNIHEVPLSREFLTAFDTGDSYSTFHHLNGRNEKKIIYRHPITTEVGQLIGDLIIIGTDVGMENIVSDDSDNMMLEKLSHNLKTPLNAIMGYSQLLLGVKDLDTEQRKYLHTITENSNELLNQIDIMLNEQDKKKGQDKLPGLGKKDIDRILIVDDVSFNRTLLRIMLERHGYSLDEAKNGREALDKIRSGKPDLVLMDITMPVMDGLQALKELRKSESQISNIPVIAVTAQSRKGNKERLLSEGFDGYLQKPFKEEELMDMIKA